MDYYITCTLCRLLARLLGRCATFEYGPHEWQSKMGDIHRDDTVSTEMFRNLLKLYISYSLVDIRKKVYLSQWYVLCMQTAAWPSMIQILRSMLLYAFVSLQTPPPQQHVYTKQTTEVLLFLLQEEPSKIPKCHLCIASHVYMYLWVGFTSHSASLCCPPKTKGHNRHIDYFVIIGNYCVRLPLDLLQVLGHPSLPWYNQNFLNTSK